VLPDLPASRTRGGEVDEPAVAGPTWHYIVGVTMRDWMKISTLRIDDVDVDVMLYPIDCEDLWGSPRETPTIQNGVAPFVSTRWSATSRSRTRRVPSASTF
jgi:hypothetical protein